MFFTNNFEKTKTNQYTEKSIPFHFCMFFELLIQLSFGQHLYRLTQLADYMKNNKFAKNKYINECFTSKQLCVSD